MLKLKNLTSAIPLSVLSVVVLHQSAIAQSSRIESFSGKVELQREGQSRRTLTKQNYGTRFNFGDLLIFDKRASVKVICPGKGRSIERQSFMSTKSGIRKGLRQLCPSFVALLAKDPPPPGLLGGMVATVPYVIAPRHTLLLNERPIFQWNAVSGAMQYRVQLSSAKGVIWEQVKVQDRKIAYDGVTPLEHGVRYSLGVMAHPGQSSLLDGATGGDFLLLQPSEIVAIRAEVEQVQQAGLGEVVTALKLAELYAGYTLPITSLERYGLSGDDFKGYHLTAEAIDTLQSLIASGQESPEIYRMLGDMYWQSGLALLARDAYVQSINLASSSSVTDREERLIAQERLGDIYSAIRDPAQAMSWYSRARVNYLLLGDVQRATGLQQRILELQGQKPS
jgi:hypothetical protein